VATTAAMRAPQIWTAEKQTRGDVSISKGNSKNRVSRMLVELTESVSLSDLHVVSELEVLSESDGVHAGKGKEGRSMSAEVSSDLVRNG